MKEAYWLANVRGISARKKRRLVETAGSARDVYSLTERQIRRLAILTAAEQDALIAGKACDADRGYAALGAQGITFVSIGDEDYPDRLTALPDAPFGLYVKGRLPDPKRKQVAVVGARMCSEYGRAAATELGRTLAGLGVNIISGMARGIDAAGHEGALAGGGYTCAVLGCGADVCYPASNRRLYGEILETGGVISEYPPGTGPLPGYKRCGDRRGGERAERFADHGGLRLRAGEGDLRGPGAHLRPPERGLQQPDPAGRRDHRGGGGF